MRKTGLLGIILICSLSTVIPVRAAAETPASLVTEVTLESEAASNTGSTEEETVSSEAVSETETDAAAQEAAPDVHFSYSFSLYGEPMTLDTEYIEHWDLGLDLRILLKTVTAVLRRDGAM